MPNVELLRKTLAHVEEYQQGWDQKNWRTIPDLIKGEPKDVPTPCGTVMCFAGEAIQLTNPSSWFIQRDHIRAMQDAGDIDKVRKCWPLMEYVIGEVDDPDYDYATVAEHPLTGEKPKLTRARARAMKYLDINDHQASVLFDSDNDLDDLRRLVGLLIEGDTLEDEEPKSDSAMLDDDD